MLIGITGRKRAGKDSAASVFKELGFGVDSFAAPIRHFVAEMLDWGPDQLEFRKEDPIEYLGGITARHLLQSIGTEWGRWTVHPDLWLILLRRRIAKRTGNIVVPDVRFDNEAEAIREMGGKVIKIDRPLMGMDPHISEAGISPELIDHVIFNGGSLEDLRGEIIAWMGTQS